MWRKYMSFLAILIGILEMAPHVAPKFMRLRWGDFQKW
jgi:hypothetical protein